MDLDNVTVTPHLGANTKESQYRIAEQAANNALDCVRGIANPNALNLPISESGTPESVKPYFELTQRLGFLAAQVTDGAIEAVTVSAHGEAGEYLDSLATFALVGALKEAVEERINYVNAPFIAEERGVKIGKEYDQNPDSPYKNKVTVRVTTSKHTFSVSGTIFEESKPRIVELGGFEMDVEPKGKMILFRNSDVPGVIGQVGMTLAQHNINIADFRLARHKDKQQAMALIVVDDTVGKKTLDALGAMKEAISVHYAEI